MIFELVPERVIDFKPDCNRMIQPAKKIYVTDPWTRMKPPENPCAVQFVLLALMVRLPVVTVGLSTNTSHANYRCKPLAIHEGAT